MYNPYHKLPSVGLPLYPVCEVCGHNKIESYLYSHKDLCEYLRFRDIAAPELKWVSVTTQEPNWLMMILDTHSIPYKAFQVHGMHQSGYDIFMPEDQAFMLNKFLSTGGYGGMTLEEYVVAICAPE